jgi:protein-L-isoaspartate(D-aspartate) O-methyltransferase
MNFQQKSALTMLVTELQWLFLSVDGRQGWPEFAPYDAIHVGAAAPEIPQPLLDQLKPGGRMVIPVGNIFQDLKVVDKKEGGSISVRSETSVRYVPLTSRDAQLRGY